MKNLWKNYKSTIILLIAIIIGAIVGLVFKEKAKVLAPLGDVFLNLMFVIIIPLVFLNISTSIVKMSKAKRFGKIMFSIVFVFIVTALVSVFVGLGSTIPTKLVDSQDGEKIRSSLEEVTDTAEGSTEEMTYLERTVSVLTVNDFSGLLSKSNLIAVIVFAVIFGIATRMAGDKGKPVVNFLVGANEVVINIVKIIMYYAPIGLGCYFAALIGTFGNEIAIGYLKTFVIYTVVALAFYFIVYTIYAFIARGKEGVRLFWKNVLPATVTAVATCSSAASIPVNIESAKKMGVSDDIAETLVPLGTSFHKDGSAIGSVFKIMFLVCLFGTSITTGTVFQIIGVALVATLLVSAVPIGGGTISEMLIITLMGYPLAALPILTIIATIIDPPATLLNVVGDDAAAMIVSRMVDGKKKAPEISKV